MLPYHPKAKTLQRSFVAKYVNKSCKPKVEEDKREKMLERIFTEEVDSDFEEEYLDTSFEEDSNETLGDIGCSSIGIGEEE